ncbi:Afadin and alpha-actinin-binding-domain-containing protein [Xylaria digitata]|nr:Afadin and alpha-actinin-binding-domain-containing protein [Xylaria digitata]
MIDPENLRTASLYINNQLLSRGLLRDGQNIDFADPEGSDGGLEVAMGRIISVVNDLILRRDRDAEHRESLSSTLRTLRTDVQRQTTEFARQTERLNDTQRRLDTAEATERALRTQLKTAEQGIHKLKEEMAKMKSIVGQTRSACANEVRKRDRQIDSLKKAVAEAGRVRGGARSRDVITISVTGEFSNEEDGGMGMPVGATESEGYSLRMETNGFLTELAKGLSEENEGLLALVRRTVDGLREMSGLDRGTDPGHGQDQDSNIGDEFITRLPQKSTEDLASELEAIVEHLRSILTNPSFVPIEEVEVRDEAINRLRAGLETMEARWKDAVHMIDGWRRRMVSGGKSVDIEDLQIGLRLSPVRVREVEETTDVERVSTRLSCVQEEEEEEENNVRQYSRYQEEKPEPRQAPLRSPVESLRLVPAPQYGEEELGDDSDSDSDSSIFQDDLDIDDLDVEEPNVQILQISTTDSIDSSPLPEPPQISPLKDSYSSGNRGAGHTSPYRKRHGNFSTIVEENTWDLAAAEDKAAPASPPRTVTSPKSKKTPPQVVDEDDLPDYTASYDSPLFGKSGEKPSQAQLNRKLFSKPSEQRTRNTAASTTITTTSQSQTQGQGRSRGGKESPPLTRTTRSSAKKSAETSPASSQMTVQAAKRTAGGNITSTTSAAATAAPPAPISTSTASSKKQAVEIAPRNAKSANSSTSSPSSAPSSPSSSSNTKQIPTRSPPRSQPTPAPSSSSRLPRAHAHAKQQSPLSMATIAAKLAASEREADAARVRAKLRAVRRNRRASGAGAEDAPVPTSPKGQRQTQAEAPGRAETRAKADIRTHTHARNGDVGDAPEQHSKEDMDPVKRDRDGGVGLDGSRGVPTPTSVKKVPRRRMSRGLVGDDVDELAPEYVEEPEEGEGGMEFGPGIVIRKRAKRTGKVASRRRSTLSPWELQGLISGRVGDIGSPAR